MGGEGRMHIYDVTKKFQDACISEKAPQRCIQDVSKQQGNSEQSTESEMAGFFVLLLV